MNDEQLNFEIDLKAQELNILQKTRALKKAKVECEKLEKGIGEHEAQILTIIKDMEKKKYRTKV